MKIRVNGDLRGTPQVRVIASNSEMLGVMSLAEALRLAMKEGLDLVEVNPKANPPVCKILDFGKFKFDEKRKAAEAQRETEDYSDDPEERRDVVMADQPMADQPIPWTPFECDGRAFEYLAIPTKQKTRPPGWPSHKASPGPWVPVVTLMVRKPGDETGPAMVFPDGTVITMEHAVEAARKFWTMFEQVGERSTGFGERSEKRGLRRPVDVADSGALAVDPNAASLAGRRWHSALVQPNSTPTNRSFTARSPLTSLGSSTPTPGTTCERSTGSKLAVSRRSSMTTG